MFQSTLLRKERQERFPPGFTISMFQSTLLRKERQKICGSIPVMEKCFNPRSCERSDIVPNILILLPLCFNPRSCERSDLCHLLTSHRQTCFNPRSCERSDGSSTPLCRKHLLFQSTLLRKERQYEGKKQYSQQSVSIHAPAKGAT